MKLIKEALLSQHDDKVVYKEYSGTDVKLDEEEFIIVEDEDILAVIA